MRVARRQGDHRGQSALHVSVAVRHPADPKRDAHREGHALVALDALPTADATVLAVPGSGVLDRHAGVLDGRLIVDATKLLGGSRMHQLDLIGSRLPTARTYRAFTCVGWENFTGSVAGEQPDMPFCGPDGPDRGVVAELIGRTGMSPVWLGDGPASADILDGLARVSGPWPRTSRRFRRKDRFATKPRISLTAGATSRSRRAVSGASPRCQTHPVARRRPLPA